MGFLCCHTVQVTVYNSPPTIYKMKTLTCFTLMFCCHLGFNLKRLSYLFHYTSGNGLHSAKQSRVTETDNTTFIFLKVFPSPLSPQLSASTIMSYMFLSTLMMILSQFTFHTQLAEAFDTLTKAGQLHRSKADNRSVHDATATNK